MALLEINATEQEDIKKQISKEPDWYVNQYKNIWYVIQRHHHNGYFCGYIGLPVFINLPMGHYDETGQEYSEKLHSPYHNQHELDMIDVHGGVTYHGNPTNFYPNSNVDIEWIGFDCAHASDYALEKGDDTTWMDKPRTYKTLDFCKNECQRVIEQFYKQLENQINCEYKNKKSAFKNLK
jgi:hypothetical protein